LHFAPFFEISVMDENETRFNENRDSIRSIAFFRDKSSSIQIKFKKYRARLFGHKLSSGGIANAIETRL